MVSKVVSVLLTALVAGCQTFAATDEKAEKNYSKSSNLSSLTDFGDPGGKLIVGVVNNQDTLPTPKLPRVDAVPENVRSNVTIELGSQMKRAGIGNHRINPDMEFGAIYYLPIRYNVDTGPNGSVIQKLCATVDKHGLDKVKIDDVFSGINRERRKLTLDGKADAKLIAVLAGIEASVEFKYVFDFQIENVRRRSINRSDAAEMRAKLLGGERCKSKYLPQAKGRQKFQLIAAYYGTLIVKQAYAVKGSLGTPQIATSLAVKSEDEKSRFLFFKVYTLRI